MEQIRDVAVDWAISHGLVVRSTKLINETKVETTTHAPITLFPTDFPKSAFEHAKEIQPIFNVLVEKLSKDDAFLRDVMESLSDVDEFTGKIYNIYKMVQKEGISQKISLGVHRSDYLLHSSDTSSDPILQQVELNTIASSFGSLSTIVHQLHNYLVNQPIQDPQVLNITKNKKNIAANNSIYGIPKAISTAFELYKNNSDISSKFVVVMVVQPGERNVFDQRWIEFNLSSLYGIPLIRKTLKEIQLEGSLKGPENRLYINDLEVAVTYFRAGYSPDDYPTEKEWDARLLVERSHTIKCPTAAYHLVGTKKVQQVLANPGVVERYLPEKESKILRSSFTGLYPLDDSPEGNAAATKAIADPSTFVMKPQREGGGNNIYGDEIRQKLKTLSVQERNAYILMDLIKPPMQENIMIRNGELIRAGVVSELGIYGLWVGDGETVYLNEDAGYLLRTKSSGSLEGGVAAGFAVLDSPNLV